MKSTILQPWIEKGYEIFALNGPEGLKVEQLARAVGKSKSSFYHHFADLDCFEEALLDYHYKRIAELTSRIESTERVNPDCLLLLVEAKQDIVFNKQLQIYGAKASYQICADKSNALFNNSSVRIWSELLGLSDVNLLSHEAIPVFRSIFYQRITLEGLSYEFLINLAEEVKLFMKNVLPKFSDTHTGQKE